MSTQTLRAILGAGILIGMTVWLSAASGLPRATAAHLSSLRDLPFTAQAAIAGVLGRDDATYAAVATPNGYRADNPAHGFTAAFTASGIRISQGDDTWSLQLLSVGAGDGASQSLQRSRVRPPTASSMRAVL